MRWTLGNCRDWKLSAAVENVVSVTGCQAGSLPDLSLKTALDFVSEHILVTFLVRMVIGKVFAQSVFDIFVLDVGLVAPLDSVGARLAGLPVADGLDVAGLALRTGGGLVCSTAVGGCDGLPGARSYIDGSRPL